MEGPGGGEGEPGNDLVPLLALHQLAHSWHRQTSLEVRLELAFDCPLISFVKGNSLRTWGRTWQQLLGEI